MLRARPGDRHRAQRVQPDFGGVGGELVTVVAIAGGIGQHRLARLAHPVERRAQIAERGLAAAEEAVEVESHRLDPVVVLGRVERRHQVAQAILLQAVAAGEQFGGVGGRRLLGDDSVQIEHQHAVADRIGPRLQPDIEQAEEHQHEDQNQ